MRKAIRTVVALAAVPAVLFGAGHAQAAQITIGGPLTGTFTPSSCSAGCTVVTTGSADPTAR